MKIKILGLVIGEADGWEQSADWNIQFDNCKFNSYGDVFLSNSLLGETYNTVDLFIDFESGIVQLFLNLEGEEEQRIIEVKPDWSVFNQASS